MITERINRRKHYKYRFVFILAFLTTLLIKAFFYTAEISTHSRYLLRCIYQGGFIPALKNIVLILT